jgi:ribosome-binding factor A
MDSIRQKQIARMVQVALSEVFLNEAKEILGHAMVTVSAVKVTPDLLLARAYISIYNTEKPEEILGFIDYNSTNLRRLVGNKIKNKVRRIPELEFYRDDTLDEVFKIENLFKEIHAKDSEVEKLRQENQYKEENPYKDEELN